MRNLATIFPLKSENFSVSKPQVGKSIELLKNSSVSEIFK